MPKSLMTIAGALALVSAALLSCGSAEAGASASQVAAANQARTNRPEHFAITEYSSSSARYTAPKH